MTGRKVTMQSPSWCFLQHLLVLKCPLSLGDNTFNQMIFILFPTASNEQIYFSENTFSACSAPEGFGMSFYTQRNKRGAARSTYSHNFVLCSLCRCVKELPLLLPALPFCWPETCQSRMGPCCRLGRQMWTPLSLTRKQSLKKAKLLVVSSCVHGN